MYSFEEAQNKWDDKNFYYNKILQLADIINNSVSEANKNKIEKIYLFGSYAYGNPNENSDLDICVVMEDDVRVRWEYVYIVTGLLSHNIDYYDLMVYKSSAFYGSTNKDSIENVIINKGRLLYER
jgi:predicted nucleotidyltransferase